MATVILLVSKDLCNAHGPSHGGRMSCADILRCDNRCIASGSLVAFPENR